MNVQKRIKAIMSMNGSEREIALRNLATELGCSLTSTYGRAGDEHLEEELIRRIHEAARTNREERLWWFALIAAVASVVSALAAWLAVLSVR